MPGAGQDWAEMMTMSHFIRRWDNYVLLLTLVVSISMILQLQLLTQYPQHRYPRYSAEYSERIIVDQYVRQEVAPPEVWGGSEHVAADRDIAKKRTLSPFERLLKEKNRHDQDPDDAENDDSDDIEDDGLPLCDIPQYTKFTRCKIEIVARPAPIEDTPEWEIDEGPWRGYIAVNKKEVYKWKQPPAFLVLNIERGCTVREMLDFSDPKAHPGGYRNFSEYFENLPNKTVLAGVAYGQSESILGLTVFGLDRWYLSKQPINGILPFVGWKGFPGHTRYIMDNTGNSSATIRTYFHFGHPFNYTIDGISYPTALLRHPEMLNPGGYWRPKHCRPRWTIALIIPYRKRDKHLAVFADNMIRFLQLQLISFQIMIIDQAEPDLFNRAGLMNIGYLEAKKIRNFDCYVFHDVDMVPEDLTNSYECSDHPRHLSVTRSVTKYRLRFDFYFGGAISMKPEFIERINGFPNRLFGWGGEDDEIFGRVNFTQMNILRYPLEIGRYISLPHGEDQGNPHVPRLSNTILANISDVIYSDGLNTMNYTVIGMEKRRLITHVLVKIPGPSRIEQLPDFIIWEKKQAALEAEEAAKKAANGGLNAAVVNKPNR